MRPLFRDTFLAHVLVAVCSDCLVTNKTRSTQIDPNTLKPNPRPRYGFGSPPTPGACQCDISHGTVQDVPLDLRMQVAVRTCMRAL